MIFCTARISCCLSFFSAAKTPEKKSLISISFGRKHAAKSKGPRIKMKRFLVLVTNSKKFANFFPFLLLGTSAQISLFSWDFLAALGILKSMVYFKFSSLLPAHFK